MPYRLIMFIAVIGLVQETAAAESTSLIRGDGCLSGAAGCRFLVSDQHTVSIIRTHLRGPNRQPHRSGSGTGSMAASMSASLLAQQILPIHLAH